MIGRIRKSLDRAFGWVRPTNGKMGGVREPCTLGTIKPDEANAKAIVESLGALKQAIDRQHEALAALTKMVTRQDEQHELILRRIRKLTTTVEVLDRTSFRQHEAFTWLMREVKTKHPLPATRGWAASPDLLLYLYELVLEKKPSLVVELGGGVSSVVIAAALKANGHGRLLSFDHDPAFAAKTEALLAREGLADVARAEHAPLSNWVPGNRSSLADSWNWYSLPMASPDLSGIDLLVVDGPPEHTGSFARYPALPALIDKLSPDCTVLLDDTVREAETKIAEAWRDEHGFTLTLRDDFEKGLAILTKGAEQS